MRTAAVVAVLSVAVTAQTAFPESTPVVTVLSVAVKAQTAFPESTPVTSKSTPVTSKSTPVTSKSTPVTSKSTPVTGNPSNVQYKATLPGKPFFSHGALSGNVEGYIIAAAAPDGVGVKFDVHFENLPASGGPFLYHIHVEPVPPGGNCTATLSHLDPLNRGEDPPCNKSAPATCQVGDLSGKHGKPASEPFHVEYIDPFVSLEPGDAAFMGNRSFVFHFANKTRITCANFVAMDEESDPTGCPAVVTPSFSAIPAGVATGTAGAIVPSAGAPNQSIVPFTGSARPNGASLPLTVTMAIAATGLLFALC